MRKDNDYDIHVACDDLAVWFADVSSNCCSKLEWASKGISGQEFSDAGWNVAIAYANCNHDPAADRPSQFGPYINGDCEN